MVDRITPNKHQWSTVVVVLQQSDKNEWWWTHSNWLILQSQQPEMGKGRTGNRISHDLLRIIMQLNLHSDLLLYGILVERAQPRRQRNREVKRWGADYNLIALVNYEW